MSFEELHEQGKSWCLHSNFAEAEKAWLQALEIAQKFGPADERLIETLQNLGYVYSKQADSTKANQMFKEAISLCEANSKLDKSFKAQLLNLAGLNCTAQSQIADALMYFRRAFSLITESLEDESSTPRFKPFFFTCHNHLRINILNNLTSSYLVLKQYKRALNLCKEALRLSETLCKEDDLSGKYANMQALGNIACCYLGLNEHTQAEMYLQEAIKAYKNLAPEDPRLVELINQYATLLDTTKRSNLASQMRLQSRSIEKSGLTAPATLAIDNEQSRQYTDLEKQWWHLLIDAEKNSPRPDSIIEKCLKHLVLFYYTRGRYSEAKPLLIRLLHLEEDIYGKPEESGLVWGYDVLSEVELNLGFKQESKAALERAIAITKQTLGDNHIAIKPRLERLSKMTDS